MTQDEEQVPELAPGFEADMLHGPPWVHGSKLGREHRGLRSHMIEDHDSDPVWAAETPGAGLHGRHDGLHRAPRSCYRDLPHGAAGQDLRDPIESG